MAAKHRSPEVVVFSEPSCASGSTGERKRTKMKERHLFMVSKQGALQLFTWTTAVGLEKCDHALHDSPACTLHSLVILDSLTVYLNVSEKTGYLLPCTAYSPACTVSTCQCVKVFVAV